MGTTRWNWKAYEGQEVRQANLPFTTQKPSLQNPAPPGGAALAFLTQQLWRWVFYTRFPLCRWHQTAGVHSSCLSSRLCWAAGSLQGRAMGPTKIRPYGSSEGEWRPQNPIDLPLLRAPWNLRICGAATADLNSVSSGLQNSAQTVLKVSAPTSHCSARFSPPGNIIFAQPTSPNGQPVLPQECSKMQGEGVIPWLVLPYR